MSELNEVAVASEAETAETAETCHDSCKELCHARKLFLLVYFVTE